MQDIPFKESGVDHSLLVDLLEDIDEGGEDCPLPGVVGGGGGGGRGGGGGGGGVTDKCRPD